MYMIYLAGLCSLFNKVAARKTRLLITIEFVISLKGPAAQSHTLSAYF